MADPPVICSENCGLGEMVPRWIRVFVPIFSFPWGDYIDGVLYEYDHRDSTRCVWERVDPRSNFFTIERLSRYENGWAFPEIEPVAGVWTWRLSIDRIGLPVSLNGWTKSFPRFGPGIPDPNTNCVVTQNLDNYVPFQFPPAARIVPVLSPDVDPEIKQRSGPCYCNNECPLGTNPFRKYLVVTTGTPFLPGYDLGILMHVVFDTGGICAFHPIVPLIPPQSSNLDKRLFTPIFGDHAYQWVFVLTDAIGGVKTWAVIKEWDDDDGPLSPLDALCDVEFVLTHSDTTTATITPVPIYICDDQAARDWVAAHS